MRKSRAASRRRYCDGVLSLTRFMLLTISSAVLAVAASGCRPGDVIEPPDMKAPVRVAEVKRDAIEALVRTIGTLKASEQAVLLAESEGRLILGKNAHGNRLEEGDAVKAGKTIAQLKNPELVATIAIDARQEEQNNARNARDRALKQVAEGILSDAEVEPARAAATSTKYAYEAGLAQLEKLKVNTPISGRIVKLADTVDGDRVTPGIEIATVMSYRTIIAEIDIANPDFPLVEPGQDVRITNFAIKDDTFDGTVSIIRPIADQTTRAFKAEIAIANEDEKLRPGMYVQADIVVARHEEALLVPPELVLTRNNLTVIFVVEDEKAVAREVHIGIETKEAVEVLKGLEPDDALIVEGFETLRDGTPVSVSK